MTYKIVRFYAADTVPKTIKTGLTLAEAQAHCNDPKTQEAGKWFDGYELEAFTDHWKVECDVCGEIDGYFDTHQNAVDHARGHLEQHRVLDVQVAIKEISYELIADQPTPPESTEEGVREPISHDQHIRASVGEVDY
jgi:hypothetical protein